MVHHDRFYSKMADFFSIVIKSLPYPKNWLYIVFDIYYIIFELYNIR